MPPGEVAPAVHASPATGLDTVISWLGTAVEPAGAEKLRRVGDTENVTAVPLAPVWLTVKVCPAMVSVPVRAFLKSLARTW